MTTKTETAIMVRDRVLPVIERRGQMHRPSGIAITMCELPPFRLALMTPFSRTPDEIVPLNYQEAMLLQRRTPDLPYRLDVWKGHKVLSLEWHHDGRCNLLGMKPAAGWLAELLDLLP